MGFAAGCRWGAGWLAAGIGVGFGSAGLGVASLEAGTGREAVTGRSSSIEPGMTVGGSKSSSGGTGFAVVACVPIGFASDLPTCMIESSGDDFDGPNGPAAERSDFWGAVCSFREDCVF